MLVLDIMDLAKIEKIELEKQKLEIKSVTINNIGSGDALLNGTQKEIMDKIKAMMNNSVDDDDVPPLVDA